METRFVTQSSRVSPPRRPASPAAQPTAPVLAWEDQVQAAADVLGLIPILNIPAEIVSGLISLRKKDFVGFGLSVAGLVPLQGEAAVALKIARTAQQIAKQNRTSQNKAHQPQNIAQAA